VRQQILSRFEQKKKAVNGMEQDDMVPYALQLFRKFPEEKQKAIDQYHYVMVDEFQARRCHTSLSAL
jgi:ATP-dependent exoDNAse (exonuclease V) beta subunit